MSNEPVTGNLRLLIWGTGRKSAHILRALKRDYCASLSFIDNDPDKIGKTHEGFKVVGPDAIGDEWDYIIISPVKYEAILFQLKGLEVPEEKIIVYFSEKDSMKIENSIFIDGKLWRIDILEEKIINLEHRLVIWQNNAPYEYADAASNMVKFLPIIKQGGDAIEKILSGCSMVRFGDGEFGLISGSGEPVFQQYNQELSHRLKEVLQSNYEKLLIGIAPNYGDLSMYPDEVADGIREYMTEDVRRIHYSLLDLKREYYDAYMFKCFIPHRDRENTPSRIKQIQRIWDGREVVLIEGLETRSGVGNDLFENVASLRRILCPTLNAYQIYDILLKKCLMLVNKESLVLVALGPAGKVLAYDLFLEGYQVVDIGQMDMDYDWYLSGAGSKVHNPYKYVSQLPPSTILDIEDEDYKKQILEIIE